ncbi:MAG: TlpA family protein disulfide reductase, partial [Acidimicrobiales bacterium]|nr:TlpA family protein disulfide reductase [Acidimicrobiales bacterium]
RPSRRRLDRRAVGIAVCVALLAAIAAGLLVSRATGRDAPDQSPKGSLTQPDPDAALRAAVTTFDGKRTTVGTYLGTPLVVNLWSSTCVPCLTEMPALERVHRRLKARVTFVGVDVLDQTKDGRAMMRRTGITYASVQDRSGSFARAAQAAGLPTTLLVDASGHVVASHTGAITEGDLQRMIDQKLLR